MKLNINTLAEIMKKNRINKEQVDLEEEREERKLLCDLGEGYGYPVTVSSDHPYIIPPLPDGYVPLFASDHGNIGKLRDAEGEFSAANMALFNKYLSISKKKGDVL